MPRNSDPKYKKVLTIERYGKIEKREWGKSENKGVRVGGIKRVNVCL